MMRLITSGTMGVVTAVLMSCGGENTTTTVTEKQTTIIQEATPEPTEGADQDGNQSEERAGAEPQSAASEGDDASSPGRIRVPNVAGKDHQLAQDTMQSAGLYNLSEEDATGQDRFMLVDRNWVVVEQTPPAGSAVNEDATIILRSKKIGE